MKLLTKEKNWINELTKSTQRRYIKKHLSEIAAFWNLRYTEHQPIASISMKFICSDFVVSPPTHVSYHFSISRTHMVSKTYNASNPLLHTLLIKVLVFISTLFGNWYRHVFFLPLLCSNYFVTQTHGSMCLLLCIPP